MEDVDTICAISTPAGEGGIGIVRVSGKKAHPIVQSIFKPKNNKEQFRPLPRKLYLGYIFNPKDSRNIDEVFAVFMNAPHTYTCEDIAEIHTHGGYAAQKNVLSIIIDCGARIAEPGEFTRRAFLNGRIDLLQAESVLDIIHSETDKELDFALRYLQGGLSSKIHKFQERIRDTLVGVEALIDFPEEDIDIRSDEVLVPLQKVKGDIKKLVDSYYEGRGIKQGYEVLITGRTNVGKSSLLNTLLLKERAIVTAIPGTTRDLIEDMIYLKGLKIKIIDTAGIREPGDIVEEEGIKRVKEKVSEADLILWLLDGSQPYSEDDEKVRLTIGRQKHIIVINKIDLPQLLKRDMIPIKSTEYIEISALKDDGLELLKERMVSQLSTTGRKNTALLITNKRHRDALVKVADNIKQAFLLKEKGEPMEFIAFELREGLNHLAEITGERCGEEILNDIFSRFCIGK